MLGLNIIEKQMLSALIFEHKTNMILLHLSCLIHDMNIEVELGLPINNEQAEAAENGARARSKQATPLSPLYCW